MSASNSHDPLLRAKEAGINLNITQADTVNHPAPNEAYTARKPREGHTCTNCGTAHLVGELACAKCGVLFTSSGKTDKLEIADSVTAQYKRWPIGEALTRTQIRLEVDGQQIELPQKGAIILGRSSALSDAPQPDIALNEFGAGEKGVSRRHACITRQGNMIYVADMGSSNGTYLNGQAILRNHNRILRSGDELQLGFLKVYIRF